MPWMMGYPFYILVAAVIGLLLAVQAFRSRKEPGRRYLWLLMLLIGIALGAAAGEIMGATFEDKLIWRNIQQFPLFGIPLLAYMAVRDWIAPSSVPGPGRRLLLSLPVLADLALICTDSAHHWMRSSVEVGTVWGVSGIVAKPTLLSMTLIAYDQFFGIYAVLLMALSLRGASGRRLRRDLALLLGTAVPVAAVLAIPVLGIALPGFTELTFLPAMAIVYWTVLRDPVPLHLPSAGAMLSGIRDGFIWVDGRGRVVEINPSAERVLAQLLKTQPDKRWTGTNLRPLLRLSPELAAAVAAGSGVEVELGPGPSDDSVYRISLAPAPPITGRSSTGGFLLLLSDWTANKRYERELLHYASIDDLTGLYNRRCFLRLMHAMERGENRGLALVLIDIDDFKEINDTYGHIAGDRALDSFGGLIRGVYGEGAVCGRMGGEEFAVCFAAADESEALRQAERLRAAVAGHAVALEDGVSFQLTVSMGIVYTEDPGERFEELYRQADEAMYRSKTGGKNQATLARRASVS